MSYSVAIDGPAGAGKSTIAKFLAKKMGYIYVDTGAMYRAMAVYFVQNNVNPDDEREINAAVTGVNITIEYMDGVQQVILNGENVTGQIRTEKVGNMASKTSAYPSVRAALLDLQRDLAKTADILMDGRDIGTTVLPHADVKIFLTASVHTRALRRFKEMTEKNPGMTLEEVEKDIRKRDWQDSHREVSPLKQAEDAVLLDNSRLTLEETAKAIMEICEKKWEVRRANV